MLGSGLQIGRSRGGEDRFYDSAKARRSHQNRHADQLRRAQSDVSGDPSKPVAFEPAVSPMSNLERLLKSVTPTVPAQYLSKTTMRGVRTCDMEFQPYFVLGDLWESFKEWSAYGAGVPLVLNDCDGVVQYYVPYLSGIQIYGESMKSSVKPRRPGEDSDSDFRDTGSDGSSDSEPDRGSKYLSKKWNDHHCQHLNEIPRAMNWLSLRDHPKEEDFSSDEGEFANSKGRLLFEYLELNPPFSREPLADKLSDLAFRFPGLKTLRSCDLLPSSWISVAWYPIYRIPTGPTLKDLDACFLTYHSLSTPMGGTLSSQPPMVTYPSEMDGIPTMSLPVFGLASYKFKGSLWIPGVQERQLANSLLLAADDWLRRLRVNHPDFLFFNRR